MVYFIGLIGLISGFALGIFVIGKLLRGVSRDQLLNDKTIKWKYGILTWLFAGLGAYCAVKLYDYYLM